MDPSRKLALIVLPQAVRNSNDVFEIIFRAGIAEHSPARIESIDFVNHLCEALNAVALVQTNILMAEEYIGSRRFGDQFGNNAIGVMPIAGGVVEREELCVSEASFLERLLHGLVMGRIVIYRADAERGGHEIARG